MQYKEKDIIKEEGLFWILSQKNKAYYVMKTGVTHSTSIASFDHTPDGLSLAEAYFNYQVKREKEKNNPV